MNCTFHPDRPATAYCRTCGRALCAEDQREIYGVIYCQECLAGRLGQPVAGAAAAPGIAPGPAAAPGMSAVTAPGVAVRAGAPSPALACVLGFIPGVGAIYNGQYFKAFAQVVIFASLIAAMNMVADAWQPLLGIGLAAFYFYMVIDAYQTAKRMELGLPVNDVFTVGGGEVNVPVAAIILIAIGGLFLLHSLGFFNLDVSRYLWPVLLIGIGVYVLLRHNERKQA